MQRAGWEVYAAARKDADLERLRAAGLHPVRIDVTDQASIDGARGELGDGPLDGLVNNAGVAVAAPLEVIPIDSLRQQLEVNLVGQVAVTQAFIPALRQAKGRIVNVSSIGGRIALPLAGPYAASKFGLEAVSDSLRRELRPWGIDVIVIEPGGVKTPIWERGRATADEIESQMADEARELYGKLAARMREETAKIAENGMEPDEIAAVVEEALTKDGPKTRYVVGREAKMRLRIKKLVGDRRFDALIARTLDWR